MRKVIVMTVIISMVLFFASCGGDSGDTGNTGNTVGDTGNTVGDTGNTADTGNTVGDTGNTVGDTVGDTGNTVDTGNTGDTADTANTGNTADSANTSDTGNTVEDTYYGTCNDIAHSGICFDYIGSAFSEPVDLVQMTCPTIYSTTLYMDHPCGQDGDNFMGHCEYYANVDEPTTAMVSSFYSPKYDAPTAKDFCEGFQNGVWYDPS